MGYAHAQPVWVDVPKTVKVGETLDITVRLSSPPFRYSRLLASAGTAEWEIKKRVGKHVSTYVRCGLAIDAIFCVSFLGLTPFEGWTRADHRSYGLKQPRLMMIPRTFKVPIPNDERLVGIHIYLQGFTWLTEDNFLPTRLDESLVEKVTIQQRSIW